MFLRCIFFISFQYLIKQHTMLKRNVKIKFLKHIFIVYPIITYIPSFKVKNI